MAGRYWRKPSYSIIKSKGKVFVVKKVYPIGSRSGVVVAKRKI